MQTAEITSLADRGVLRVGGVDAAEFLQGLLTNDIAKAVDGAAIFAGLLSPQGKILFDFFVVKARDDYLIDCPLAQAADLARRLTFYKLRAKVAVEDISSSHGVAASLSPAAGQDVTAFADPRYAPLGYRSIGPKPAFAGLPADDDAYQQRRVHLMIPEGGKDYPYGDSFPHEACYDQLNGVDFKKGCYIGQEVVSRMEHRATVRRRIIGLRAEQKLIPQSGITANGKPLGTVGSVAGKLGIAMVRLDRLAEAVDAGETILAGEVPVSPLKPGWAHYDIPRAAAAVK